jgi:hypothetical protein
MASPGFFVAASAGKNFSPRELTRCRSSISHLDLFHDNP